MNVLKRQSTEKSVSLGQFGVQTMSQCINMDFRCARRGRGGVFKATWPEGMGNFLQAAAVLD